MNRYFPPKIIKQIVKKTGTPVYIYSKEKLIEDFKAYKKAFNNFNSLICYALKANSNRAICSVFAKLGAGADVVSGGELFRALNSGFEPKKIVFSGAGKTENEIIYAFKNRILMINVESFEEMLLLEKIAKRLNKTTDLSVRINPDIDPKTHKFVTTGKSGTKFGVSTREALKMYEYSKKSRFLNPVGIHFHLGSQIDSTKPYEMALKVIGRLVGKLKSKGININYLDIGGGWAVPEDREGKSPSILAEKVLNRTKNSDFLNLNIIVEPGRSLVARAGILVTEVLYRKNSGFRKFIIVDAGMNDLIRPAFYEARHPVMPVSERKTKKIKFDVVGPVCESSDFLAREVFLPEPLPGDLLAILSVGAYGFSMSSQYNSRPRAAEVLITSRNTWKLIRKRETFQDLVAKEI